MPKPLTRRERSVRALYRRMLKAKDRAEQQYDHADTLTRQIAEKSKGQVMRISDSVGIVAEDQFEQAIQKAKETEMPKGWAHAAFRQFKIKEVTLPAQ